MRNGSHLKALSPLIPRNSLHTQRARDSPSKRKSTDAAPDLDSRRSIAHRENRGPTYAPREERYTVDNTSSSRSYGPAYDASPATAGFGTGSAAPPAPRQHQTAPTTLGASSWAGDRSTAPASAAAGTPADGHATATSMALSASAERTGRYRELRSLGAGGRSKVQLEIAHMREGGRDECASSS